MAVLGVCFSCLIYMVFQIYDFSHVLQGLPDWFLQTKRRPCRRSPSPLGCAVAQRTQFASATRPLWERACPRRIQRGGWHRLRRCSRRFDASTRPLPQRPCSIIQLYAVP
ncbi:hypothetical protein E5221_13070 [Pseudomonas sp. A2]|nr:hypothetical protein E5221_13070 [Pseudomonas sp. A2]